MKLWLCVITNIFSTTQHKVPPFHASLFLRRYFLMLQNLSVCCRYHYVLYQQRHKEEFIPWSHVVNNSSITQQRFTNINMSYIRSCPKSSFVSIINFDDRCSIKYQKLLHEICSIKYQYLCLLLVAAYRGVCFLVSALSVIAPSHS